MGCASMPAAPLHPRNMTPSFSPSSTAGKCGVAFAQQQIPAADAGTFAFARIRGDVCFIQVTANRESPCSSASSISSLLSRSPPPSPSSDAPSTAIFVKVFRHEFINIFRLSHCLALHSEDVRILEYLGDAALHYDEEQETVFLARELVAQLSRMSDARFAVRQTRYPSHAVGFAVRR